MATARRHWIVGAVILFILSGAGNLFGATRGVVVSWDASPDEGIAEYHIFYGTRSGIYTNAQTAHDPSGEVIVGLLPDVTYYFAVMAVDLDGHMSPLSGEVSATIATPRPVKLSTEIYTDGNGVPYGMTITGTNSTLTDWELDYSTDMVNWYYLTGNHSIEVWDFEYFDEADQMFFRLVDH